MDGAGRESFHPAEKKVHGKGTLRHPVAGPEAHPVGLVKCMQAQARELVFSAAAATRDMAAMRWAQDWLEPFASAPERIRALATPS